MTEKSAVERGWEFSTSILSASIPTVNSSEYVAKINKAVDDLHSALIDYYNNRNPQVHGYIFETWTAGTLNINAAIAESTDLAHVNTIRGPAAKDSYDIYTDSGAKASLKAYENAERGAKELLKINPETGEYRYGNETQRVVPKDKVVDGTQAIFENKDGVQSKEISRDDLIGIRDDVRNNGDVDMDKYDISTPKMIKNNDILSKALEAGYTAAIITAVTQIAPEIYKALDYLIKNGELRVEDILRIGGKGITGTSEGFLRGAISSSLCIMCESGMLGEAFKGIPPSILGTMVALTMQTIKNSILVAFGKLTPKQMGAAFADSIIVSSGFLLGAKIGSGIGTKIIASKIGGAIGQALGLTAPVIGYLIGSLVGTAFSVVYNIGKKKFISFCVDTGFTCFGLVEQDYQLPEEFLNKMGINTIKLNRTPIHQANVSHARITQTTVNRKNYETIGFTMPRRGLIGVNKVGYVI